MTGVLDTVGRLREGEIGILSYLEGLYTKKKTNHLNQLMPNSKEYKEGILLRENFSKIRFMKV